MSSLIAALRLSYLSTVLLVSILFYIGENQASRVRTPWRDACGAGSGGWP